MVFSAGAPQQIVSRPEKILARLPIGPSDRSVLALPQPTGPILAARWPHAPGLYQRSEWPGSAGTRSNHAPGRSLPSLPRLPARTVPEGRGRGRPPQRRRSPRRAGNERPADPPSGSLPLRAGQIGPRASRRDAPATGPTRAEAPTMLPRWQAAATGSPDQSAGCPRCSERIAARAGRHAGGHAPTRSSPTRSRHPSRAPPPAPPVALATPTAPWRRRRCSPDPPRSSRCYSGVAGGLPPRRRAAVRH